MPRTTQANQRIREAQRAKILESARSVFARKGMAATITDIAAEAQISLGLAYRYFADKEAIFSELVKQTIPADPAGFQRLLEMPGTPGKRLAVLISSIVAARGHRESLEAHQLLIHALQAEALPDELARTTWQTLSNASRYDEATDYRRPGHRGGCARRPRSTGGCRGRLS